MSKINVCAGFQHKQHYPFRLIPLPTHHVTSLVPFTA